MVTEITILVEAVLKFYLCFRDIIFVVEYSTLLETDELWEISENNVLLNFKQNIFYREFSVGSHKRKQFDAALDLVTLSNNQNAWNL